MTVWIALNGFIIIQKSPFNKVLAIYQTYFVTRSLFQFSIKVTRLIFNPHHTFNKVTRGIWLTNDDITADHCPLFARTWCCGRRLLTTERCPRWPMCRVTPGLPRPLGPATPHPGQSWHNKWRHRRHICHPHTSMWRLIYAIMPCPLSIKCCCLGKAGDVLCCFCLPMQLPYEVNVVGSFFF